MHAYTVQRLYKAILGDYSQVSASFSVSSWEECSDFLLTSLTLRHMICFELYN